MASTETAPREAAGVLLRRWRQRRNMSQLVLATRAGVSTRHLSFVECGKASPSRALVRALAEQLEMPLREENRVLLAAGHAPAYPENRLNDAPLAHVNEAINAILDGNQPFPAVVVDHGWDLVAANDSAYRLMQGAPAWLLEPPINVVRLSLHPEGLSSRILNLREWHRAMVNRLSREYRHSGDERLATLVHEISGYSVAAALDPTESAPLVVPLRLRYGDEVLNLITTTTVFGTPQDVTLAELAIECFYPADARTRSVLLGWTDKDQTTLSA